MNYKKKFFGSLGFETVKICMNLCCHVYSVTIGFLTTVADIVHPLQTDMHDFLQSFRLIYFENVLKLMD